MIIGEMLKKQKQVKAPELVSSWVKGSSKELYVGIGK